MQGDLVAALDAFDRVIAAADGLVEEDRLEPIARTVRSVRDRAGYLGDTLVAAVAGGTGSGKSSLINALAGEEVTESGGMRPTTGVPVAWIPANPEPGVVRLLDDLGVKERVGQDLHPWLALLDLPDTDSVVVDHRHTVEALLPRVDLVLWVIDPEKYQDRVLHQRYLEPLAAYERQFVFVLNQIDRLEAETVTRLVEDLAGTLAADGITRPKIVPVAADPDAGPPIGVDDLVEMLEQTVDVKRLVYDKLATDLSEAARQLSALPDLSGGVGFGTRWDEARLEAARLLAEGERRRCEAHLNEFIADLADEVGGGAGDALRDEVGTDAVSSAVEVAYESSGAYRSPPAPPAPAWVSPVRWLAVAVLLAGAVWGVDRLRTGGGLVWPVIVALAAALIWVGVGAWTSGHRTRLAARLRDEQRRELVDPIARQLDTQLGRKLRTVLRRRAGATAAATELNLALAELDRRLGER
ncbi:MAG TPA: GTPase [Acidimicrobiia bacterium]|nr:GTPase [Acidimicrobiia bacterium]